MPGLIERYRQFLPVSDATPVVSLNEGSTPLVELINLPKLIGFTGRWYAKFEGLNPTGSFKDRGMTMAISKAKEAGSKVVMCASTGNTSASAAAYAARAGMGCAVLIPEGKIALGKLSQAMLHGALVIQIKGNFDDALDIVREITNTYPIALVNSVNPFRLQGQKTGAFEIVDELGNAPDYHCIPVGNAGNISAYWMGYNEYVPHKGNRLPKMVGFQAEGSAPLVLGHPIDNPETIATAIRIGKPASWDLAVAAVRDSGGSISAVSDAEILEAQKLLAAHEGLFCEPASAASVAGVIKQHKLGYFESGKTLVSVLTGHGLKDPNTAISQCGQPVVVESRKDAVLKVMSALLE